jgi:hypothetical protein
MKFILNIVCGLLVTTSIGIAASMRLEAADTGDKPPLVVSGYVTKIDLKKKEMTVHGTEVIPAGTPQKFTEARSLQAPGGGRGGGGRGGSSGGRGGGGGGGGRGSRTPEEADQDFSVKVGPDTMIQTEKGSLTLNDLRVQDYVLVLGTSKGKSINATSISVTLR